MMGFSISSLITCLLLSLACLSQHVAAKAVFAHFMVGNTASYTVAQWKSDIDTAAGVGIDAFALNIANGDQTALASQISNAFTAANQHGAGFYLFFSFDYAANGAWAASDVSGLIGQYQNNAAYYKRGSQPFVSTFEGPGNAADWAGIKATTGCFFMPSWSSLGAQPAVALANGVADGLFSWAGWSWGGKAMNTYVDASYYQFLSGKPYMMPVSPWFYTNLPQYDKNWAWPVQTLDLWEQRWIEVLAAELSPEYVEIISWNDFGESHYIGPVQSSPPFASDATPYDYVTGMPHDGWRQQLAVWTQLYKTGTAKISSEILTTAYLLHPISSCSDGGTTVNTATQLQYEYTPASVFSSGYYVSYTAILGSTATVTVTVGGKAFAGTWTNTPVNGIGVYHGTVNIGTQTGSVQVTLARNGATFATINGNAIGGCDPSGYANMNPWVGYTTGTTGVSTTTNPPISKLNCTAGTGAPGFDTICGLTCSYGYCPMGACVCTQQGIIKPWPVATMAKGYPKTDPNYLGLCSWAYTYGFASQVSTWCQSTQVPISVPVPSPFLPFTCTAGKSNGAIGVTSVEALCEYICAYGACPIRMCQCTSTGALAIPTPVGTPIARELVGAVGDLASNVWAVDGCRFSCQYGVCSYVDLCYIASQTGDPNSGGDGGSPPTGNTPPTPPNWCAPGTGDGVFSPVVQVGSLGTGAYMCDSNFLYGIPLSGIEAWWNKDRIRGLRFTYSDGGLSVVRGMAEANPSTSHAAVTWDPYTDLVAKIQLIPSSDQKSLGHLLVETVSGKTLDVGAYLPPPNNVAVYPDLGGGIILGAVGDDGDDIDNLGFMMLSAPIKSVLYQNITYNVNLDDWNRQQTGITGTDVDTHFFENLTNFTSTNSLYAGSVMKSSSYTMSLSETWPQSYGVGLSLDIEIPGTTWVFKPGGTVSGEWGYSKTLETQLSNSTTVSVSWTQGVTVEAHSVVKCTSSSLFGKFSSNFTIDVGVELTNGKTWQFQATGQYSSATWSTSKSSCGPVDPGTVPAGANITYIQ